MIICNQLCEWNGYEHGCRKPYFEVCPLSNSVSYKPNHMTNGDRIRAMSDEELVRVLGMMANGNVFDLICDNPKRTIVCDSMCVNCIAEWLKQPAEEEST